MASDANLHERQRCPRVERQGCGRAATKTFEAAPVAAQGMRQIGGEFQGEAFGATGTL
jgi:hypothetical protein